MRAPRALVPLLAVAGAVAVLVAAGTGAEIKVGTVTTGPAVADAAESAGRATVHVLTWNVCGDVGCDASEVAEQVAKRIADSKVGGRDVRMDAVFLQDVCSAHIDHLKTSDGLASWSWVFAPETNRKCASGQGELGVAVGAQAALSDVQTVPLPSPDQHERAAVCGTASAWKTRLCSVRLSAGDDPQGRWRAKQIERLGEVAVGRRTIIGGDFTERPESPVLDPLYRTYAECDQGPGESRTGAKTRLDQSGTPIAKTDYLFISKTAGSSCGAGPASPTVSDHRPLAAAVRFN